MKPIPPWPLLLGIALTVFALFFLASIQVYAAVFRLGSLRNERQRPTGHSFRLLVVVLGLMAIVGVCMSCSGGRVGQRVDQVLAFVGINQGPGAVVISGAGNGNGRVVSQTGELNCKLVAGKTSGSCSQPYSAGAKVNLTATPESDSIFVTFSDPCGAAPSCTVTMNENASVTATFSLAKVLSITNPPPASWYPYPRNSLWTQRVPADAPQHDIVPANYNLSATSAQAMVSCALTGCGDYTLHQSGMELGSRAAMRSFINSATRDGSPSQDDQGKAIWISQPGDPYYHIHWTPSGDCYYEPNIDFVVQIPDQANWPGTHDTFVGGIDTSQNLFWSMSRTGPHTGFSLPHCTSTDPKHPCELSGGEQVGSSCTAARIGVDKDWDYSPGVYRATVSGIPMTIGGSGDNLSQGASGSLGTVRLTELMGGIFRMTQSSIGCVTGQVFPATSGAFSCRSVTTQWQNYPPNGAWLYCDYTDSEIASMNLPPWQDIMLVGLCHHGTFPSVTDATNRGVSPLSGDTLESEYPFRKVTGQHHPVFAWLNGQKLGSPNSNAPDPQATIDCGSYNPPLSEYRCSPNVLYGIPPIRGLDVIHHFHIADPCLMRRLIYQLGGDGTGRC